MKTNFSVKRLEVITDEARRLTEYGNLRVEIHFQDGGQTAKIFVKEKEDDT